MRNPDHLRREVDSWLEDAELRSSLNSDVLCGSGSSVFGLDHEDKRTVVEQAGLRDGNAGYFDREEGFDGVDEELSCMCELGEMGAKGPAAGNPVRNGKGAYSLNLHRIEDVEVHTVG